MNRQQRRHAAKNEHRQPPADASGKPAEMPQDETPVAAGKWGFIDRWFANIVLSPWVLARVKDPAVEQLLANVAIRVGRTGIAKDLLTRVANRRNSQR